MNTKDKLIQYSDAGYPIIYINSFEETKTDTLIKEIMGGRKGLQWNVSHNFVNMDGITIDENIEATPHNSPIKKRSHSKSHITA